MNNVAKATNTVFVIFSDDSWPKRKHWRTRVLNWLIKLASRSRIVHCAIADNDYVLSVYADKTMYHYLRQYIRFPNTRHVIRVTLKKPISIEGRGRENNRIMPSILKWFTLGRVQTDDCVCVTKQVLAEGGVEVDQWAWNPRGLYEWLKAEGYEEVSLFWMEGFSYTFGVPLRKES